MLRFAGVAVCSGDARDLLGCELAVRPAWHAEDLMAGVFDRACFVADDVTCLRGNDAFDRAQRSGVENEICLGGAWQKMDVLGLELKGNWQVYRFSYGKDKGRDLDFMGFRFYRYKTTVRKRIMYKMTRKARKISKKKKPTSYDARQMISYYSWLIHTNSHKLYLKHVKPYVDFFTIRQIISRKDQNSDRVIYRKLASAYILS